MYKCVSVLYTVQSEILSDIRLTDFFKDTTHMMKIGEYTSTHLKASKGQKLIAALFLVTNHLSETDPMRLELRDLAVQLATDDPTLRRELSSLVAMLLGAASLAGIVSEGNARIIEAELKYFAEPYRSEDGTIAALFPAPSISDQVHKGQLAIKRTSEPSMSFITKSEPLIVREKKHISISNKSNRQEKIVSYINERKSVNIKDISMLFPDVSEKTIQRELGALVASGKITKRGNKRWSIYLAVQV